MALPILYSAKRIEQQFHTGEEPVLVMCSDVNTYVCKYMRSSATAYKLACELIGARMAKVWHLNTPDIMLVKIKPSHWDGINISHSLSAPSLGCRWLDGVIDIFVSIDYGCIFNTATFDYPLSQLTSTDTILWSDWTKGVWNNFIECLNENINHE